MKCQFQVGQKVVCVSKWFPYQQDIASEEGIGLPDHGAVYTVRDILTVYGDEVHIRLAEIVNPTTMFSDVGPIEVAFSYECFRPVIERKTSIEVFKAMLNPSRVEEVA